MPKQETLEERLQLHSMAHRRLRHQFKPLG